MRGTSNPSDPFTVQLAGRSFTAISYRGARSHSDTVRLHDEHNTYVLRRSHLVPDGLFVVMLEGTDQFLWHAGHPVQVYWLGDIIEQTNAS